MGIAPPMMPAREERAEHAYVVRLVALFCAGWAVIYADRTILYPLLTMLPLMALSLVVIPQVTLRTGMLLAFLAYGLVGKLAWDPLAIAWLGDYAARRWPETVGTAVALFSFSSVVSAVVAPPVTGWIKDITGSLAGGFYLAAAVALAAFALSLGPADGRRDRGGP